MDGRWNRLRDVAGQPVSRSHRPDHCGPPEQRNASIEKHLGLRLLQRLGLQHAVAEALLVGDEGGAVRVVAPLAMV